MPNLQQPPWRLRLEVDEPGSRVAVAVDESGEIIGLAAAGVPCDANAPTAWELYSINVLAERQGGGLSDDLILAAAGNTDAVVWVATDNARAQGFYNRHGFKIDGAKRLAEDLGTAQMRMVRRSAVSGR